MTATLYRIDGVKLANGRQAYGSREMAAWLPVYLRYMRDVHGIRLTVIKVADVAATIASAGTHVRGYAVDERTWSLTVARQRRHVYESTRLGRPTHLRTRAQGFDPHAHSMLDVGRSTPCSYQIDRTRQGRDGLARNGPDLDRAHRPPQPWMDWRAGVAAMLRELDPPSLPPIPRHRTPTPWMVIREDGTLSGQTISRLQWQLDIQPTGHLDHYTIRALKHWLDPSGAAGGGDDGTGILRRIDVLLLQYRIGTTQDGAWGPVTTRALQRWLNLHR